MLTMFSQKFHTAFQEGDMIMCNKLQNFISLPSQKLLKYLLWNPEGFRRMKCQMHVELLIRLLSRLLLNSHAWIIPSKKVNIPINYFLIILDGTHWLSASHTRQIILLLTDPFFQANSPPRRQHLHSLLLVLKQLIMILAINLTCLLFTQALLEQFTSRFLFQLDSLFAGCSLCSNAFIRLADGRIGWVWP